MSSWLIQARLQRAGDSELLMERWLSFKTKKASDFINEIRGFFCCFNHAPAVAGLYRNPSRFLEVQPADLAEMMTVDSECYGERQ